MPIGHRRRIRSGIEQQRSDFTITHPPRGLMQGRNNPRSFAAFFRPMNALVGICSALQQHLDHFNVVEIKRPGQRIRPLGFRPMRKQQAQPLGVACVTGMIERLSVVGICPLLSNHSASGKFWPWPMAP